MKLQELINKGTVHKRNDGYWAGMVSYKNRKGEYCRKNFCGLTKKSVKQKMLNTGLRVGEVLGLINSDIDIETRILYVRRAVKEVNSLVQNDSESKREAPYWRF